MDPRDMPSLPPPPPGIPHRHAADGPQAPPSLPPQPIPNARPAAPGMLPVPSMSPPPDMPAAPGNIPAPPTGFHPTPDAHEHGQLFQPETPPPSRPPVPGRPLPPGHGTPPTEPAPVPMDEEPEPEEETTKADKFGGKKTPNNKKSRRGKPRFAQAGLMLVILIVMFFLYNSIRSARVPDKGNNGKTIAAKNVNLDVKLPQGWKSAKQKDAGGKRMAWGASGSKQEGMFVIQTELREDADVGDRQFRSEIESGLRATGAKNWKASTTRIDGQDARRYIYSADKLRISTWFVVKDRDEWQFSCQWRTAKTQDKCTQFMRDVRLHN